MWQFYHHQGHGFIHLVLSSSTDIFHLVILLTPSPVISTFQQARKGKGKERAMLTLLRGKLTSHRPKFSHMAAFSCGRGWDSFSMTIYSAKTQDLIIEEGERKY